ncbi:MAG: glycosyltransferase [Patescibacteria group bacterium]|nr:glycosyltransferase [Patescibacteria group bacterium]
MVICYFGIYNKDYARNKILISGLKKNGVEVIECNSKKHSLSKYFDLIKQYWKLRKKIDIIVVGFPGQTIVPLAKLICRKKIVFDAFLSLYDSMVLDRKLVPKKSLKAKYYWFFDWLSCKLADEILLDTNEHINYFIKTFNIKSSKFNRIFIGADDATFYPRIVEKDRDKFIVHFHGTYIPLQGVKYIIEAANILKDENIFFRLIGNGQEYKNIKEKIEYFNLQDRIELVDLIPVEEVSEYIAQSDICLGIFGDTIKAKRVIPNKLYECIAMRKPVITANTLAMMEAFRDNQELAFCQIANAQSLANKILELKNNQELREKLARQGYDLYKKKFCPSVLGLELLNILKKYEKEK